MGPLEMTDRRTLRIQLASDLHLELFEVSFPGERLIAPAPDADLLVLAGDVANGIRAIELFADWPVPVLYVAGNHEYYGLSWESTRVDLEQAARGRHFGNAGGWLANEDVGLDDSSRANGKSRTACAAFDFSQDT